MTTNAINYQNLQENIRHNLATEQLNLGNLEVARRNVDLGYANVGLGYANLAETQRANQIREVELNRHNVAEEEIGRTQAQNALIGTGASLVGSLVSSVVRLF